MKLVFDVETDGLLTDLSRVHTLVLEDLDTGEQVSCADQPGFIPIAEGLVRLREAEEVWGHNILGFDLPALAKVYPGYRVQGQPHDSYTVACFVFAHVADSDFERSRRGRLPSSLIGSHALEAWGHRLGIHKKTFDGPWDQWSSEMQSYCGQDVRVNAALVRMLLKRGIPAQAEETETEVAQYLAVQMAAGVPFNVEKAVAFQGRLAAEREALGVKLRAKYGSWLGRAGKEKTAKRTQKRKGFTYIAGAPYTPLKEIEFNPGSRDHIAYCLKRDHGWVPAAFTQGGKPQIDDVVLERLDFPGTEDLQQYLLVQKRLGQLAEGKQAWLTHATFNKQTGLYHIHGRVKQNDTITHRAAHSSPNLGQVPKVTSPYGQECRELFGEGPEGWVLVGADASGLEARCLAHYMAKFDDGAYAKVVLSGDIHTTHMAALGDDTDTTSPLFKAQRDVRKTWFYAYIYGAGDEKLGKIANPALSEARAKKLGRAERIQFEKGLPALGYLTEAVGRRTDDPGYLIGLDGRRVYIRARHSALNTLLQSAGAIICKRWIAHFARRLREEFGEPGWSGQWVPVLWVHDEVQVMCRKEIAERKVVLLVESMRAMTEHFAFRLPLDGEAKIGRNWKETH